jgi:KipI family sensor histidine kinase inhibitor
LVRLNGYSGQVPAEAVAAWIADQLPHIPLYDAPDYPVVTIPVRYGGEYGTDLADVARLTGLTESAVVERHTSALYTVAFIGFAPGFPYLTGLPADLELPRHAAPKKHYPAGSVAIAGRQTCIYPQASAGGWRIIGQTDFSLFDPLLDPPAVLQPLIRVKFEAISFSGAFS